MAFRNACITIFNDFLEIAKDKDDQLGGRVILSPATSNVVQYCVVGNEICPETGR